MTEREQLVRAIIAAPNDNTLRLAYSDFCEAEDRGFYAEFIRQSVVDYESGKRLQPTGLYFERWFNEVIARHWPTDEWSNGWQFERGMLMLKIPHDDFVTACGSGAFAHVDAIQITLTDKRPWNNTNPKVPTGWQRGSVFKRHWPDKENSERAGLLYGVYDPIYELLENYIGKASKGRLYASVIDAQVALSRACCVYGIRRHFELIQKTRQEETCGGKYQ